MKVFKIVSILPITSKQYHYVVYRKKFLCWKKFRVYRGSINSLIRDLCVEFINPKIYIELNDDQIKDYIGETNTRPGLGRIENKSKDENI